MIILETSTTDSIIIFKLSDKTYEVFKYMQNVFSIYTEDFSPSNDGMFANMPDARYGGLETYQVFNDEDMFGAYQ